MKLPLQTVGDPAASSLTEIDVSSLPAGERQSKLDQAIREEAGKPIDFTQASPLGVKLFCLAGEKNLLLLTLPAICADALSLGYVATEIAHFYGGGVADGELPAEPLQYADFSEWQNTLLESADEDAQAGKAFWTKRASEDLPPLTLPFARKAARHTNWKPESVTLSLAPATGPGLDALAKAHGTTPAAILFAGCPTSSIPSW